ncbi:predicted protein [Plenodomus lingam JN3]|uniref:Predicted protein n=1 Tax=Leptosphaeria maculans (strain JN3 / isolate v23.1.3 / race Av1-4-5-6-7-8) TaxID=985895 RepID=E5A3Y2_LEPMJ|nr:predicted protein [Plenodomus lingam JN3]CBX98327.1 predicted protein [Plenodomus lingam JN3]
MQPHLKQELVQLHHHDNDGYGNLTHRMENEEDDQFDCDLTILDFLVYKATGLVFEWRSSSDPFHSDLPSALVNMTADWRTFLAHKHHGRHLTPKAAFRSRLLQFALVFTHRLHHVQTWTTPDSLAALHAQNQARAEYWSQRTAHPQPFPPSFTSSQDFPHTYSTAVSVCALASMEGSAFWYDKACGAHEAKTGILGSICWLTNLYLSDLDISSAPIAAFVPIQL